jgi:hypothetical protein
MDAVLKGLAGLTAVILIEEQSVRHITVRPG